MLDERDINNVLAPLLPILDKQNKKGLREYGATLRDANLSASELLNHGMEELVDLIQYLGVLKDTLDSALQGEEGAYYHIKLSDDEQWYLNKNTDTGYTIGPKQKGLRTPLSEFTIKEIHALPNDILTLIKQKHLVKVDMTLWYGNEWW